MNFVRRKQTTKKKFIFITHNHNENIQSLWVNLVVSETKNINTAIFCLAQCPPFFSLYTMVIIYHRSIYLSFALDWRLPFTLFLRIRFQLFRNFRRNLVLYESLRFWYNIFFLFHIIFFWWSVCVSDFQLFLTLVNLRVGAPPNERPFGFPIWRLDVPRNFWAGLLPPILRRFPPPPAPFACFLAPLRRNPILLVLMMSSKLISILSTILLRFYVFFVSFRKFLFFKMEYLNRIYFDDNCNFSFFLGIFCLFYDFFLRFFFFYFGFLDERFQRDASLLDGCNKNECSFLNFNMSDNCVCASHGKIHCEWFHGVTLAPLVFARIWHIIECIHTHFSFEWIRK